MAKLVPPGEVDESQGLGAVRGRLEEDGPFFAAIDAIVAARPKHRPRAYTAVAGTPGEWLPSRHQRALRDPKEASRAPAAGKAEVRAGPGAFLGAHFQRLLLDEDVKEEGMLKYFKSQKQNSGHLKGVLKTAGQIQDLMTELSLGPTVETAWKPVRANLGKLSDVFGIR
jgi:hypothetical protein